MSRYLLKEILLKGRVVLVGDTGAWIVINTPTYQAYQKGQDSPELFTALEENGVIVTDKNRAQVYKNLKLRKPQFARQTSLHIMVVTLRCNAHCLYCHASARSGNTENLDMSLETAKKTVEFIFQSTAKNLYIEFQGGEPLLNFGVVEFVVNYAKELAEKTNKSVFFSLISNLSLMTAEKLAFLQENQIKLSTSLDGPKDLHLKNRPMHNADYQNFIHWVKHIKTKTQVKLGALLTVTKHSLAYPKEIVDTYKELGFKTIWFRKVNNIGAATKAWAHLEFSAEEYFEFWKTGVEYAYQQNLREQSSYFLLQKLLQKEDPNFLDLMSPCGGAIGQMAYHFNGDIFTCDEGRMLNTDEFRLGSVYENSFDEIINSHKVERFVMYATNDKLPCNECPYQPFCGICPACNYANTGNLLPTETPDIRCQILKMQFEYLFEKIVGEDEIFKETIAMLKAT